MKRNLVTILLLGLCLSFFSAGSTFAATEDMLEKQKEVDDYVFVEHQEELAEKGITVTHTAPLENTVEIGITPYTEENISYLQEVFGGDNVTVVEGQQAVTLQQTSAPVVDTETPVESAASKSPLFMLASIVLLAGLVFAFILKKRRTAI